MRSPAEPSVSPGAPHLPTAASHLQIHTLSARGVILSAALLATKSPVEVRESAPRMTPPLNVAAMMVVCGQGRAHISTTNQSSGVTGTS